jgi:hypothetical protein
MVDHTSELLDALEFKFPAYQFCLIFDWSSGHAKYPADAPNIHDMNVNYGGKQSAIFCPAEILEDYVYPENFPENLKLSKGMFQYFNFREGDPPPFFRPNLLPAQYVGKPKGMKQILYERGLFRQGMTEKGDTGNSDNESSFKFVLSNCLDFRLQKSALQELIESRGHICDFLPKYHPELSPIERSWALAKKYVRARCKQNYADMLVKVKKSLLDTKVHPLNMIRRYFRKTRDYLRAYETGCTEFKEVYHSMKTYKSHRKPPPSESNAVIYKPHQKKKALKAMFDAMFLGPDPHPLLIQNSNTDDAMSKIKLPVLRHSDIGL